MGLAIRPTRAEIDLGALVGNAAALAAAAGTALAAVVKADAYGHGAVPVARALEAARTVVTLGVSLVEEGVELRAAGLGLPILVLGPSLAGGHRELCERGLTAVVSDAGDLEPLAAIGRRRGAPVAIHLKVDSGMGRLGIAPAVLPGLLQRLPDGLVIEGLCTHLADADLPDEGAALERSRAQLSTFAAAVAAARAAGHPPRVLHAANSAGLVRLPEARLDLCRPGLALYGNGLVPPGARQVMRLRSQVAQLRDVPAGQPVGYGGVWRARRPSRLAVVPIGYADGYARRLTGSAEVLVGGRRCPVVGAISMDITLVDVTALGQEVEPGDEVVLLGGQRDEFIAVAELGARAGLTEYEVTCGISKRVPRVHLSHSTS